MTRAADIWQFQTTLSRRLLFWALASLLAGAALLLFTGPFGRGFAFQALVWGGIEALIALAVCWRSRRRLRGRSPSQTLALEKESRRLRRVLWISTAVDPLYVAAGVVLALTAGQSSPYWLGHGWGIIPQGAFLFFFDLIHAQSVPPPSLSGPLPVFKDPVHDPFFFSGGPAAALLVHGFPGSPAEMRSLAESLLRRGWTVEGPLLPGFGRQLPEILEYGSKDWLAAVSRSLEELKGTHRPVLLVGYSMGAALSISAAARVPPDGLVLLAPFWRLGSPAQRLAAGLLRPFLPRYFRPLQKADFANPRLRRGLGELFPSIDLEAPGAIEKMRSLQAPVAVIRQVMETGLEGYRRTPAIRAPVLVIQGVHDELVSPSATLKLVDRFRTPPRFLQVEAGHNLVESGQPAWEAVEAAVAEFAASIARGRES
jgi:carboxylesterase